MSERAKGLAERIRAFNKEVSSFVEGCSEKDWAEVLAWEGWPVGVTARHIAAGHYEAVALAKKIISGETLPEITMGSIIAIGNEHAREHAGCTREEVLAILNGRGEALARFVADLEDPELDRTAYLALMGTDVTVCQFIELVILQGGNQHLTNMKAATGA